MRRAIFVVGCLLLGCQGSGSSGSLPTDPGSPDPTPSTTPSGTTSASAALAVTDRAGASGPFRMDGLDYLDLKVTYTGGLKGNHAVRISVLDPKGIAYAHLPGSLEVGENGAAAVSKRVHVRGTDIQRFDQLGTWQFVASVDGVPMATTSVDIVR